MRLVAREKNCTICKQRMDFMIVSMFRQNVQSFQSFGICEGSVSPGVRIDHLSSLYFVNCAQHNKDLDKQRAMTCSLCQERFRHKKDLSKHLSAVHDSSMCHLCLDNLSLFVCEQSLYSKNHLKVHMGVHPQCEFCRTNLFDSMQLYTHMRDRHFSCYLCPASHQHRFYKNIGDLELHFKNSHITCSLCFSESPVGARSYCVFRSNQEYRDHMLSEHNINLPPNSTNHLKVSFKFNKGGNESLSSGFAGEIFEGEPAYLDLFIEDRGHDQRNDRLSRNKSKKDKNRAANSAAYSEALMVQLIPEHMRVAGRVTGTGLFTRDASDDLLEQHSREIQAKRSGYAARVTSNASEVRHDDMFDFPTLVTDRSSPSTGTSAALHPLSLVNQIGAKSAASRAPSTSNNFSSAARNKRSDAFAEALGIDPKQSLASHFRTPPLFQYEAISMPLYPSALLTWAVVNKAVLLKTEKRIAVFMEDKNAASLQLPPMLKEIREGIHDLALYYCLTSHEFDREPKRYISLVKNPTSRIPPCLLSAAALKPWVSVASVLQKGNYLPGVYISVQEPLKAPVFVSTIVHKFDALLSEICAAEFGGMADHSTSAFSYSMKVLRPHRVDIFNAATVVMEFSSVAVASRIHATLSANLSQFGENFAVFPAFPVSGSRHFPVSRRIDISANDHVFHENERLSAWDDEATTRIVTEILPTLDLPKINEEIDPDYIVVQSDASLVDCTDADEDEWEKIDTKKLLIKDLSAKAGPAGHTLRSVAAPFPTAKRHGDNDHFVPPIPDDPEVVAKREEEWSKFLDDHKPKAANPASSYVPPFRRPQPLLSEASSSLPSSIGQNFNDRGSFKSSMSKESVRSNHHKNQQKNDSIFCKKTDEHASFSILQLEDDTDSSESES